MIWFPGLVLLGSNGTTGIVLRFSCVAPAYSFTSWSISACFLVDFLAWACFFVACLMPLTLHPSVEVVEVVLWTLCVVLTEEVSLLPLATVSGMLVALVFRSRFAKLDMNLSLVF